ncbi:hypothetical protein F4778DRAFT_797338 [Xylariomycetidae sp. FL2044]|nr:hypothetical protein F4778DRAFT_797338 [Xylariomycetidae sp. FL2044]
MTSTPLPVNDQIRQLEGARGLVRGDPTYYPQVIQAALSIVGPGTAVQFRRWGADFIAEAFATPALPIAQKETLSLLVLETLKSFVEDVNQDVLVLRSVIQAAASIYPLALRWMLYLSIPSGICWVGDCSINSQLTNFPNSDRINNSYDTATWQRITAIKTRILHIWDTAPLTIRICCIKFVQRVVLAQTSSINPEPRRGDPLDISLAMVPPNHPVLDGSSLEAEASGLLDRMLGALQDDNSDCLVIDATLNTLSILVRARPATSNRIINVVLTFNPFKLAKPPLLPKTKVLIKSMEKTTRMLLIHLSRRDHGNPLVGRMQQQVERLLRSRAELFDRKRALVEHDVNAEAKRQRTQITTFQPEIDVTPLKPGPHSLAEVFTFTRNEGLRNFNVADVVPPSIAAQISVTTIARLDPDLLERAINGVRDRLKALYESGLRPITPETAPLDVEEDEDDYEPDYHPAEDTEQLLNKLDSSPSDEQLELQKPALTGLTLPTFHLPPPPTLNQNQAAAVGQGSILRVLSTMRTLEDPYARRSKAGFNRLAASSYDRDSWITVMTRLATRTTAGAEDTSINGEDGQLAAPTTNLSNYIREALCDYVLQDFRKRIDVGVSWLNEEWYNDRVQQHSPSSSATPRHVSVHYDKLVLKLLDGFFPYLNSQDKLLVRFLSELPELNAAILFRVKRLCVDPSLVNLALTSLYYLVMMRPPVRDLALDTVQDIWTEFEEARPMAAKYLQKWRPGFLEAAQREAAGGGTPIGMIAA